MDEGQALEAVKKAVNGAKSGRDFAASHGISQPYFSQIITGKRPMPDKLLEAVGLERITVVTYRRKPKAPANG